MSHDSSITSSAEPVILGSWQALQPLAGPLRHAVFVVEQQVPAEMEWDEFDPLSLHAVLRAEDGTASACGRLLPVQADGEDAGLCRIGRMAVRLDRRGQGLGARVLDALILRAKERGDAGVLLHAQCSAQGFYAGRGFIARGDTFDEAGIEHIEMVLRF